MKCIGIFLYIVLYNRNNNYSPLFQEWKESCSSADVPINFWLASILFNNNHGRSLHTLWVSLWFWILPACTVIKCSSWYNVCIKALSSFSFDTSTEAASAPVVLSLLLLFCCLNTFTVLWYVSFKLYSQTEWLLLKPVTSLYSCPNRTVYRIAGIFRGYKFSRMCL